VLDDHAKRVRLDVEKSSKGSEAERLLDFQLKALKFPEFVREYKFHTKRRWRFDFAWPSQKIAVELHGGIFTNGRHTRGQGFLNDREKINEAIILGWKVGEFSTAMVKSGEIIVWLERMYDM